MIKFHHFRKFLIKILIFDIQSLATEIHKVINNMAVIIIDDLFTTYHSSNLQSKSRFVVPIKIKILYNTTVFLSGI